VTIRPRLNVRCGRCGRKREGLIHHCLSNSRRRATIKLVPVLGGCSRCGKQYGGKNGNPLTHVCRPRQGEFRRRKNAEASKAKRDKERAKVTAARNRERHRSKAQIARLKASYEARLAAARAKAKTPVKSRPAPKSTKPRKPAHEYQSCMDKDCQRPVCIAFKEGYRDGDGDGYQRGLQEGYSKGFPDGIAACPRSHQ
jgi:hypothetical protein